MEGSACSVHSVAISFGAHMSIAGGLDRALRRGRDAGCDVIQMFTASPRGGPAKDPSDDDVRQFDGARRETGISTVVVHAGYLINLAAPAPRTWTWAVESLAGEIRRASLVRAADLVLHPGAHVGAGEEAGIARIVKGLDEALRMAGPLRQPGAGRGEGGLRIALEITAGQGSCLGHRFEHLRAILDGVRDPSRFSVCFDTCHALAAGYDIRTAAGVRKVLAEFDRVIGLDRLTVFHLNDSVKGLGCRVDRHTHIGKGEVGLEGFRAIVRDRRFRGIPMILETPKDPPTGKGGPDNHAMDRINLATLRKLAS
jgi:deoxyribonuclease-4